MQFSGQWRDYQQRVLDEFDAHIGDDRLHVVAAPGSGKTVLGLELLRRIGRPAIILAPSLTIRDQWPARLVPLFMDTPPSTHEVSTTLAEPAALTCATYQSMHAVWSDEDSSRRDDLLAWAKSHGPMTLVLDEAHHLRREWWTALDDLIDALDDVRIVALTATPPYDAPFAEWQRYLSACGPIDIEIGIPELVRNGDLCPHQDHVIASPPSADLMSLLEDRRFAVSSIIDSLRHDAVLIEAILQHPWLTAPEQHVSAILETPERLSSMLVHLAAAGLPLPKPPLKLLGADARDIPRQSDRWSEVLLNLLVFGADDISPLPKPERRALRDRLHRHGLIEGKRVILGETRRIVRMMAGDRAKITSIGTIAKEESRAMGADLRMVVLADHVRAGELPKTPGVPFTPAKLGVAPIFESLRRLELPGEHLAVLTGSLVILPVAAMPDLQQRAAKRGLTPSDLRPVAMPHCDGHVRIEASGKGRAAIVALITEMFTAGSVTILVGTQALLGEGWDAPAINSLVLASNSASYMLSNQMRGRAIRVDPARPDKVSNIWHLATLEWRETGALAQWADRFNWGAIEQGEAVTADLAVLARRFQAFAGISNDASELIESGLGRLRLFDHAAMQEANTRSFARSADRAAIAQDWARSLGHAPQQAHVRETASPSYAPRGLAWRNTLEWLTLGGMSAGLTAGAWQMYLTSGAGPVLALAAASSAASLAALPKVAKALQLGWRNGSLEGSLRQVAGCVLQSLAEAKVISEAEVDRATIITEKTLDAAAVVVFKGLSRPSELAAMEALSEVLGPVSNPRYLLVRKASRWVGRSTDYHAVPSAIGRRKDIAEAFAANWNRAIGPSDLIFCRSEEGRPHLLKARSRSLAAGFQRRVERRSSWR